MPSKTKRSLTEGRWLENIFILNTLHKVYTYPLSGFDQMNSSIDKKNIFIYKNAELLTGKNHLFE